jgi:hypothetical protein
MANTTRIAHPTAATTAAITIGDFEGKLRIRRTGGFANLIRSASMKTSTLPAAYNIRLDCQIPFGSRHEKEPSHCRSGDYDLLVAFMADGCR